MTRAATALELKPYKAEETGTVHRASHDMAEKRKIALRHDVVCSNSSCLLFVGGC